MSKGNLEDRTEEKESAEAKDVFQRQYSNVVETLRFQIPEKYLSRVEFHVVKYKSRRENPPFPMLLGNNVFITYRKGDEHIQDSLQKILPAQIYLPPDLYNIVIEPNDMLSVRFRNPRNQN